MSTESLNSGSIRVLHLTWGLGVGGKERFLDVLVRGLPPREFVSSVCCLRETGVYYDPLVRDGFSAALLNKRPGLDLAAAIRLQQVISRFSPQIIHAHEFTSLFLLRLARLPRAHKPARVVASLHGGHARLPSGKAALYRWLLRRSDLVIAVAQRQVELLQTHLGDAAPLCHIPYGVDVEAFSQAADDAPRPGQRPMILMVARIEKPKDQDSFIEAMHALKQEFPGVSAVLVGDGTRRPEIEALIAARGLTDDVHIVTGTTDVQGLIAHADVCVLASTHEGLPISILEYMAAGKPVVASDVGGVAELIGNAHAGILVKPGDPNALAQAIAALLRDPNRAREMGRAARARTTQYFDLRRMIDAYAGCYRRLTSGAGLDLCPEGSLP